MLWQQAEHVFCYRVPQRSSILLLPQHQNFIPNTLIMLRSNWIFHFFYNIKSCKLLSYTAKEAAWWAYNKVLPVFSIKRMLLWHMFFDPTLSNYSRLLIKVSWFHNTDRNVSLGYRSKFKLMLQTDRLWRSVFSTSSAIHCRIFYKKYFTHRAMK